MRKYRSLLSVLAEMDRIQTADRHLQPHLSSLSFLRHGLLADACSSWAKTRT